VSTVARRWCALGSGAMVVLHALWHGFLAPPATDVMARGVFLLFVLPILPALVLFSLRHRHAPFWAAVAALLYFCHGIMEAWTDRSVWPLGLAEAALATWIVVTASWDGMRARFGRRAPPV
jgi:uncharacterized membrane protein